MVSANNNAGDTPVSGLSMWGGRFSSAPSQVMQAINQSIHVDKKLYAQDIQASRAHAAMLQAAGIVSLDDFNAIDDGLVRIEQEIENGRFHFMPEFEDIHMNIEARLRSLIGDAAGRLHTARSRNDQVATDIRLWLRDKIDEQAKLIVNLIGTLLDQAKQSMTMIMPGYTHMQVAQPVSFAHHLMAYAHMFMRDLERMHDARKRLNESPLGAAALAGTAFPIDRVKTADALGFSKPMENSMDAVASRDFIMEYLSCASILSVHLSRLSEEIVYWMNDRFQFISLPDELTTGSSIMPQKRNPDAAELVRAKPGRIIGALNNLLILFKGLPLTYSKDMQDDKQPLFDACDSLDICLAAMQAMINAMKPNPEKMLEALESGYPTATDLADWLVRELNLPFREAHHITGALVKQAEKHHCKLEELSLDEMQSFCPEIHNGVYEVLDVKASLYSRNSYGGTAPGAVLTQIKRLSQKISEFNRE